MVEGNPQPKADQAMINYLQLIVLGLFLLKILWNVLTPFVLARRLYLTTSEQPASISMAPFVEIALWLLLLLTSFFSDDSNWLNSPNNIALWGICTIIGSYIVFAILGFLLGWFVRQLKK
jgi:Kef-type K+ transport system membrane component KefB